MCNVFEICNCCFIVYCAVLDQYLFVSNIQKLLSVCNVHSTIWIPLLTLIISSCSQCLCMVCVCAMHPFHFVWFERYFYFSSIFSFFIFVITSTLITPSLVTPKRFYYVFNSSVFTLMLIISLCYALSLVVYQSSSNRIIFIRSFNFLIFRFRLFSPFQINRTEV